MRSRTSRKIKKIVFCIDELNIGGTEKQLLSFIERLDRKLFEPYLVCLRPSVYLDQCSIDCHKVVVQVTSLFSWDGIKKLLSFSKYLRDEKIDIAQTFFFDATVFGVLAAKIARVSKILSSRRDMGFWYSPLTLFTLFIVNRITHRIVVNSEAIKVNVNKCEHVNIKKIDVIYNGIDLDLFFANYDVESLRDNLEIPSGDQVVGIVANLNRQVKRVDLFVAAAAEVLLKQQNVSFIVVGEGHLSCEFAGQADDLGIGNKIHFVGSHDNVIPYLQLFNIGVLTSDSEGFPNAILEYMAAGLPVVCSDSGGNRELIKHKDNGFLVVAQNPSAFASAIVDLLENPSLCKTIKNNNHIQVTQYGWDVISLEMQAYYNLPL